VTLEGGSATVFVVVRPYPPKVSAAMRRQGLCAARPWNLSAKRHADSSGSSQLRCATYARHDHDNQCLGNDCQAELRFLGMTSRPTFVQATEAMEWRNGSSAR